MPLKNIVVENATQNNLKHLDIKIPHGELVVITGVSGSGKSSLAFDTIYAEGQRRYVETFSPYARQFLDRMDKPKVDRIDGIPPAIAIDQTNPVRTSRSTVGTMTELNDHLKLLFARTANLHCPDCGKKVVRDTPDQIVAEQLSDKLSDRAMVTFNVKVPDNFTHDEIEKWLQRQGYTKIHKQSKGSIEVIQDRFRLNKENKGRITEALEAAFKHGRGKASWYSIDEDRKPSKAKYFSSDFICATCDKSFREPSPSLFSFNSPLGACEACRGFGRTMGIDYNLVVPNESLSLAGGAIKPWQTKTNEICQKDLLKFAKKHGIPTQTPWKKLTAKQKKWVLQGEGDWDGKHWYGVKRFFDWLETRSYKMHVRVLLSKYRSYTPCTTCNGARLKPQALWWRVGTAKNSSSVIKPENRFVPNGCKLTPAKLNKLPGLLLHDIMQLPLSDCARFFANLELPAPLDEATSMLMDEINSRVKYLNDVGLSYLTLDRQSRTLSGGEVQRINLTTALGTSLVNTLFVLDEPSIGLHPRDIDRVIGVLKRLRDSGNSLLVVEHDPQIILAADKIIDMGPGPGSHGGEISFYGNMARLASAKKSLTASYLRREKTLERRPASNKALNKALSKANGKTSSTITIKGASEHNLKSIDVEFPLNRLVCITGVSGSGKSTLIQDTLYRAICRIKGKPSEIAGAHKSVTGHQHIDEVVMVDQSPIGKSARSNPVSYTGAFDGIRKLFAEDPEAKRRSYTASSFSFNSGMRCPTCSGNGFEHVEMQFLSDVYLRCHACNGSRYREEVLDIKLVHTESGQAISISDTLNMTVDDAVEFFANQKDVLKALRPLVDVGLGYLTLGQPVPTLSGGEAQRLKLAAHLAKAKKSARSNDEKKLFLFDEPTTGLHFDDIKKLLFAFEQLLQEGHSLIVVEHNLDVISNADWIIDLGPEGGDAGGSVIGAGTVSKIKKLKKSHTGKSLIDYENAVDEFSRAKDALAKIADDAGLYAGDSISVVSAREHNLKNIDVQIPRDKYTVITGLSGSGKSTLAFDILFNEGQRRYLESLNAYARQFVQPASRPDVDAILGIPPTVAIEQRTSRGGRKSTVATMTELYHFMRLLFVKLGTQHCPDCDKPIDAQSLEGIQDQISKKHKGKKISVFAPLIVSRKGYYTDLAKWAGNRGFDALRVDGETTPVEPWPRLDRFTEHDIDLPIGEVTIQPRNEQKIAELLQRALDYGKGVLKVSVSSNAKSKDTLFSIKRACTSCGTSFPELDPRLFSYNSKHGWCDDCFGTGIYSAEFDEEQTGEENHWLQEDKTEVTCPTCEGRRLNPTALSVKYQKQTIADLNNMSISESGKWFAKLKLKGRESEIARDILLEINSRLQFLNQVGLSYLALDRAAPTLSGGEAQRIRLASQLGSNLQGVCYILDEPTIGLHSRDNQMLLDTLEDLGKKGNTIVVVEHDEDTIRRADHIIDLGPGAGIEGGRVVATGTLKQLIKNPASVTGRAIAKPKTHPYFPTRKTDTGTINIKSAVHNNLKKIDVKIPLGKLVSVTGVSGSGKSTLVRSVLGDNLKTLLSRQNIKSRKAGKNKQTISGAVSIDGWEPISRILEVDQTPIGKTPRSCPATYIGFWDNIRRIFADATEARVRGYTASRFSFNVAEGRCASCDGQGMTKVEMSFLPDVKVPCDVCKGARFNSETLSVLYKGKSIGDVLQMSIDEAVEFFTAHKNISHPLQLLKDTGLGYLTLGQQSPTLSGGEAQRIKLVAELAKAGTGKEDRQGKKLAHTLYVLDEPTVGLHMADVDKLIGVLHRLVESGNSVIVIEHNLELMANSDWVIDMGPEGGDGGGRVIAQGVPAKVAKSKKSYTAPFLEKLLSQ